MWLWNTMFKFALPHWIQILRYTSWEKESSPDVDQRNINMTRQKIIIKYYDQKKVKKKIHRKFKCMGRSWMTCLCHVFIQFCHNWIKHGKHIGNWVSLSKIKEFAIHTKKAQIFSTEIIFNISSAKLLQI